MARRILIAISIALIVVEASALLAIYFSIKKQDDIAFEQSITVVSDTIDHELEKIGQIVKDYSWWNDAYQNLAIDFDETWAHTNIGLYLYELHHIDVSLVIGPDDQILYGQLDGQQLQGSAFSILSPGLGRLIEQSRATPKTGAPIPAIGILSIGNDVMLAGVSAITAETESIEIPQIGSAFVLVGATKLSSAVLQDIEARLPVKELNIVVDKNAGYLPLIDPSGSRLAVLDWIPNKPGTAFITSILPWVLGFSVLLLLFTLMVLFYVRQSAARIELNERRFRDVASASSDWIWETDRDLNLTFLSRGADDITGGANEVWLGRPIDELFRPIDLAEQWQGADKAFGIQASFRNILCICCEKNGQDQRTLQLAGKPIYNTTQQFDGYRGTATDITREVEARRLAEYAATHDTLTKLVNRDVLYKRLQARIETLDAHLGVDAVVCFDLDRFKDVNDTLGHPTGDELLRQLADRVRACSAGAATIARISGDEFAIIQTGQKQPEAAEELCEGLLQEISKPFHIKDQSIVTTASFGIALIPDDGVVTTAFEALQKADIALYEAKRTGRGVWRCYDRDMDRRRRRRQSIEMDLRLAIDRGEFELYYQPMIAVTDPTAIIGAEALIRWHHPQHGLIEPESFIHIAEETGAIMPLSDWVVREACSQVASWPCIQVAINISPLQFRQRDLVQIVRKALDETGLEPNRLEIEITEGVLLKNTEMSTNIIEQLREIGIQIVIDDFGTGYSNIAYMQKFSFDKLKIDRSFLAASETGTSDLVRPIVDLGHSLNMRVCSEGVETADQLAFLQKINCDEAQGFYIGHPLPAQKFTNIDKHMTNSLSGSNDKTSDILNKIH